MKRSTPHDPRPPPSPGTGRSGPDRKGTWHHPAGTERAGADLRHRDHLEGPGHVRPGHVRAGDPRGHPELADDFKEEITRLRIIARDAAITAELWLRSKHGTWRFFLVTPNSLVEIDRKGKRLVSGQTVSYMTGALVGEEESSPSKKTPLFPRPHRSPYKVRLYLFSLTLPFP